ncbi:uncharacterized protein [Venturia canescens]|uniref:uncharacterized protein isoform X2 n=1 Tax=Venturia canescens TaxID=32260 RepID=UPI001C9CA1E1|nr:uncharacterized protein LOC122411490 isoform X2 [Venturia canescens]XP_043276252.1 uncharacterized protein LOC122411490 isoform X2 [Venturia canescens]
MVLSMRDITVIERLYPAFIQCIKWTRWIIEVLHWSVHTTLGYILMLAVMTYNAYIGIALVIGASFGYWLFGMTLIEMNMEQFRKARNKIDKCDPECADVIGIGERRGSTTLNAVEHMVTEVNAEIHSASSS